MVTDKKRLKQINMMMDDDNHRRFKAFLSRNPQLKMNRFVELCVMKAVEQDEAIRAGKTQIDFDALQGR